MFRAASVNLSQVCRGVGADRKKLTACHKSECGQIEQRFLCRFAISPQLEWASLECRLLSHVPGTQRRSRWLMQKLIKKCCHLAFLFVGLFFTLICVKAWTLILHRCTSPGFSPSFGDEHESFFLVMIRLFLLSFENVMTDKYVWRDKKSLLNVFIKRCVGWSIWLVVTMMVDLFRSQNCKLKLSTSSNRVESCSRAR